MKVKHVIGLIILFSVVIAHSPTLAQETTSEQEKLNLNITTLEELKDLPGMTPETAQAIIENRPYETLEDLLKVTGMSDELLAKFQDGVEVKKVNVNTAPIRELKLLPGITPEMAKAIIDERPYKIVEELLKIQGIGEELLANLKDFIEAKPRDAEDDPEQKGWKTRKQNYPASGTGTQQRP